MKQLISQSRIDEAAKEHAKKRWINDGRPETNTDFESGVQFALNEIQPLMVEFTQYVFVKLIDTSCKSIVEQLLEEFIKTK